MNKKQIREKYANGKLLIDLSKHFNYDEKFIEEMSTIDGELYTTSYSLNSTIIDDLSRLSMGYIDDFWPYNDKEKYKIQLDQKTLYFIHDVFLDISNNASKEIERNIYRKLENIEYEIPVFKEVILWKIYILINEINKYVYNVPLFNFAEEMINSKDKDIKDFIEKLCDIDIKYLRRNLFVLFDFIISKI